MLDRTRAAERRAEAAERRAEAAERRAEELLAAVSELLKQDGRCIGVSQINTTNRHDTFVTVRIPVGYATLIAGPLMCALYLPGSKPNPEILERASLRLAELYIDEKAKAEAATSAASATVVP